jgi:hypothetical protein
MTDEERTAVKLANLLSDHRLNLDKVGTYLARLDPSSSYRRVMIVAEAADEEWEIVNGRHNGLRN